MSGYCEKAPGHAVHHGYHAEEYGFPVADERVLFERLALEIMQAGLSWEIVLKKRAALNKAFSRFQPARVARYGAPEIDRLLQDEAIIRNRLKIAAIIENARRVVALRKTAGGLAGFLAEHHPMTKTAWVKLFRKTFLFTGGEITGEFLMSIGYLPGAHHAGCPVHAKLVKQKPPWLGAQEKGFRYV